MHEILPHIADVRVRLVTGELTSLFREASDALFELVRPLRAAGIGETITLTVKAHDSTALLVDFLNELLLLLETHHFLPGQIDFLELGDQRLVASIAMRAVESWERDVKAVTYHEAEIRSVDGELSTTLVFDI
ncbi:MAG: archease [Thermoanaerobaculia bacterium]|nr:archease [Thermoanaerobaculia bacterium]